MDVISDTGPIIALAKVGRLHLLKSLFDKVYITPYVFKELMAKTGDEAEEIEKALNEFMTIGELGKTAAKVQLTLKDLGRGERQCIEFASTSKDDFILLMDDKAGRQAARKLNIPITGIIGVLIMSKNNGLVENITEILHEMREKGYWLSEDIVATARKLAEE